MIPCDTLADVHSAIDQIDQLLAGLQAERARYVQEAARLQRPASASPAGSGVPAKAQCRVAPRTAAS
ncbi:chorismate mutase [Aquabacterium sp.]|jgi:chorismate mutase|uniref:chorismate mutase n=1 Tax=Aquabacterium sp. TaxID=1872578 RepID=UPI0025BD3078|nr:chorismate mutase [Aquabacterium sp.]